MSVADFVVKIHGGFMIWLLLVLRLSLEVIFVRSVVDIFHPAKGRQTQPLIEIPINY